MKMGYVVVSNQVMRDGKSVGYIYREEPENENDSGWRVFSGEETQEYADNPDNFAFYNASSLLERAPELKEVLGYEFPIAFERSPTNGDLIEIEE